MSTVTHVVNFLAMSVMDPPAERKGRFISTIEILLWMREKFRSNAFSPLALMGVNDIRVFQAFLDGMTFRFDCEGGRDEELGQFYVWLRDVKGEFPSPGGWAMYYLTQTGDHLAGIMRFLDRVAEFSEMRRNQR